MGRPRLSNRPTQDEDRARHRWQDSFTNGIAFGIDNTLYANASFTGEIYFYDVFGSKKP